MRPCISFPIVWYHGSVPAPAPPLEGGAPPGKRPFVAPASCETQKSQPGSPPGPRHRVLEGFKQDETSNGQIQPSDLSIQLHKSTGRPVERGGTRCKSKKKKHKPESLRIKMFASATRKKTTEAVSNQRGCTKQRREVKKNI